MTAQRCHKHSCIEHAECERTTRACGCQECVALLKAYMWHRVYIRCGLFVRLVKYEGNLFTNRKTGHEIVISTPRYWALWWRVWADRRARRRLARATVVRR